MNIKIGKARELAVILVNECDPENLVDFLNNYLSDSDVSFGYSGDDFIVAYTKSMDGEKLLKSLLEDDEDLIKPWMNDDLEFPKCSVGCEFIEMLGASECDNVCPEKFKKENKDAGL